MTKQKIASKHNKEPNVWLAFSTMEAKAFPYPIIVAESLITIRLGTNDFDPT